MYYLAFAHAFSGFGTQYTHNIYIYIHMYIRCMSMIDKHHTHVFYIYIYIYIYILMRIHLQLTREHKLYLCLCLWLCHAMSISIDTYPSTHIHIYIYIILYIIYYILYIIYKSHTCTYHMTFPCCRSLDSILLPPSYHIMASTCWDSAPGNTCTGSGGADFFLSFQMGPTKYTLNHQNEQTFTSKKKCFMLQKGSTPLY